MRFFLKSKVMLLYQAQKYWLILIYFFCGFGINSSSGIEVADFSKPLLTGADQIEKYLPYLMNKRVSLVVNQTSMLGNTHLVDTLLSAGISISNVFSPEHGFRGDADAGELIKNSLDEKTGLPLISLYGKNKKPQKSDLEKTDVVVFDIQDVGVRFYTYISTLHYVMEACAENNLELLILDRPNPNMSKPDGPMMEPEFKSFVGMHPVPIIYGMSIGEYAQMINGEYWLPDSLQCKLKIIKIKNLFSRNIKYILPIPPSPNLPNQLSIDLYPSLCLFEGTVISVARGTLFPFQAIGHPFLKSQYFEFTPVSIAGMSKNPPFENKVCYGTDLREIKSKKTSELIAFDLHWLIYFYTIFPDKEHFFNSFFEKLAGTGNLRVQIQQGITEQEIRKSWAIGLERFSVIRKKYLLYKNLDEQTLYTPFVYKKAKSKKKSIFYWLKSN